MLSNTIRELCSPATIGYICRWQAVKRNLIIAGAVGLVLSMINQLDIVLRGPVTPRLVTKIASNFVIPFVVSSVSAALNRGGAGESASRAAV